MIKSLFTSFAIFIVFTPTVMAENRTEENPDKEVKNKTLLHLKQNLPGRRNMPSKFAITCIYCIEYLEFELPENTNSLKITLGDEMFPIWSGIVNKLHPETNIPYIVGETQITCEDDLGRKYVGVLDFRN